jgi:hypothetical protein
VASDWHTTKISTRVSLWNKPANMVFGDWFGYAFGLGQTPKTLANWKSVNNQWDEVTLQIIKTYTLVSCNEVLTKTSYSKAQIDAMLDQHGSSDDYMKSDIERLPCGYRFTYKNKRVRSSLLLSVPETDNQTAPWQPWINFLFVEGMRIKIAEK